MRRKIWLALGIFLCATLGGVNALIREDVAKDSMTLEKMVQERETKKELQTEQMAGGEIETPNEETAPTPQSPPPLTPSPSPPPYNKGLVAVALLGTVAIASGIYSVVLMKRK